jgi:hypothetical protein
MDPLIAGTKIEAGQFVKIGPDGKVYPCTEDEGPMTRMVTIRPTAESYMIGTYIEKDEAAVVGSDGCLRPAVPKDPWNDIIGYATYPLREGDRVKLGPASRLYRLAPPDPRLSPLA